MLNNNNQLEMDFCTKIINRCTDKGLEMMKTNLTIEMYRIWEDYAISCLQDISTKISNFNLINEFRYATNMVNVYPWQIMSEAVKYLINVQKKIADFYLDSNNNIVPISQNTQNYYYNNSLYSNPYIYPTKQDMDYFTKSNSFSQYNLNAYNTLQNILTPQQRYNQKQNEDLILSIINSSNNNYNSAMLPTLPIGVVKTLSDVSIELIASKIKEDYFNDFKASLVIDGIKELAKAKMKQIIDEWYADRRFY